MPFPGIGDEKVNRVTPIDLGFADPQTPGAVSDGLAHPPRPFRGASRGQSPAKVGFTRLP